MYVLSIIIWPYDTYTYTSTSCVGKYGHIRPKYAYEQSIQKLNIERSKTYEVLNKNQWD